MSGRAAGRFGPWLAGMEAALDGVNDSDVPCGSCTACCHASQFIHIAPDETDTISHIPRELLFPAPRAPKGHVLMGYDRDGRCPMLVDDRCSIYAHRPRTCRTYDCRVFPASGLTADDPEIAATAGEWTFTHEPGTDDETLHAAVRAAAAWIDAHRAELGDRAPVTNTQWAVDAIELRRKR